MKKENDNHTEILDSNMLLSKNIALSMNTRKTYLNDNICVIGGSGSGKTRNHVKPNLLQMYCNYVLVDPKGYNDVGQRKYHNNKMRYFLCPT